MLLIDQFEEAFVACHDEAERAAFFDALLEGAADADERLRRGARDPRRLLWALRQAHELSTAVAANQVLVGPMRRDPFHTGLVRIPVDTFPPAFALSPDGRALAVARLDGRVDLIDAQTLRRTRSFEAFAPFQGRQGAFPTPALTIEYTPDGGRLAVAGGRGLVGLWDARSGRRVGPLLHGPTRRLDFVEHPTFTSPCGDAVVQALAAGKGGLLAAAEVGGDVRIWVLGSHKLIGPPLHVLRIALGAALSPDGSQLAVTTGYEDSVTSSVVVRSARSGEQLASCQRQRGAVRRLLSRWQPDRRRPYRRERPALGDRRLAAGGATRAQRGAPRSAWPSPPTGPHAGHLARRRHGRALGRRVARQPIGPALPGPAGRWATARFSPDGSRLFIVYDDGTAVRWEVDPGGLATPGLHPGGRRPHRRAVGGARPRAGLHLGLPLGLMARAITPAPHGALTPG